MKTAKNKEKKTQLLRALAIAHETIWKTLSNRNRIEILYKLHDSSLSWSELMFSLQINPKSLSNHLKFLQEYGIVDKKDNKYFLTEFGKDVCEFHFIKKPSVIYSQM